MGTRANRGVILVRSDKGFLDHGSFLNLRENLPEYLKDPITFLYLSGWRVSEMKALEWRDVDLPGKVVRLRPEISKNKDGRILPLDGELLELIERARERRQLDCPYVFQEKGRPIGDFRKAWWAACVAVGLGRWEKISDRKKRYVGTLVHDFRRTAVRNLVRADIPERVAMTLTGHKTRSVFDRYNIVSEADLVQAADKLRTHLEAQAEAAKVKPIKRAHDRS